MKKQINYKLRYNIITVFTYIIGIVLLIGLFNLQIVHGEEYLETSNTRLTRESTLKAARGNIRDNSGTILAGTATSLNLEIYKSKIDTKTLNETLLKVSNVLEQTGSKTIDNFPIKINPFSFTFNNDEREKSWKQTNKIEENLSAEETFYKFKEKYQIENDSIEDTRKIMALRYQIALEGYSSTKSVVIAQNLSEESVHIISEQNDLFPGVGLIKTPVRAYPKGTLASHILGYTTKITEYDYKIEKDNGYVLTDYYGQSGIERVAEKYLKGTDGIKQIDMAVDGTMTDEYISEPAIRRSRCYLNNRCITSSSNRKSTC